MSINENQEFNAINQRTGENRSHMQAQCYDTEAIQRDRKRAIRKKAVFKLSGVAVMVFLTAVLLSVLQHFECISYGFGIILMVLAGGAAMFQVGYIWHDIQ